MSAHPSKISQMSSRSEAYVEFAERYLHEEYAPVSECGYSCQTWLARLINDVLHPHRYYCWFSKTFDPYTNGDDSNPVWLYITVDRAVKQGATNNAKIKDIRSNLMRAVKKELHRQQKATQVASLQGIIAKAPLSWLRPEIWRIDLKAVDGRYTGGHQYRDEFNINDLNRDEFVIVVE